MTLSAPHTTGQNIEDRLARLERENRRLKIATAAGTGVLVCALLLGAAPRLYAASQPLSVSGAHGRHAVLNGSDLTFYDSAGTARIFIGFDSDGLPSVDLHDAKGKLRASTYLTAAGHAGFVVVNSSGQKIAKMFDSTSDQPGIRMWDRNGKDRLDMYVADNGEPEVDLSGPGEDERATLQGSDKPFLRLTDGAKHKRAFFGVYDDGSSGAYLHDATGKAIWQVPQ